MALRLSFHKEHDLVLVKGNSHVKELVLNKPKKLNSLNYEMVINGTWKRVTIVGTGATMVWADYENRSVSQLGRVLRKYENDPKVKLVIIKGNGKAFCAGGDVVAAITSSILGHWSYVGRFYRAQFHLDYLVATYKKPTVCLIDGVVMGGGAGLSMNSTFRVVTEKAVFAMPEVSIWLFPNVGASYFLSRLPGYFGEYLGLVGARLNGAEMVVCGLAAHLVPFKDLNLLEEELLTTSPSNTSVVAMLIDKFAVIPHVKEDSAYKRLDIINKCFSRDTVENILQNLENEVKNKPEKWIVEAIKSMKSSSPSCMKIFLKSIREGRTQNLQQYLVREYHVLGHILGRSFSHDFYEGSRAKLFDKDNKPKWEPSDLELVTDQIVDRYFNSSIDEEYWKPLDFSAETYNHLKKIKSNL